MKAQTEHILTYQLDKWPDFNQLTFGPEIVSMAALLINTPLQYTDILDQCAAEAYEIDLFLAYAEAKHLLK